MAVNTLFNIQLSQDARLTPSQMWPDWGESETREESTELTEKENKTALQASIQYLENM